MVETKNAIIIGVTIAFLISIGVHLVPNATHFCQDLEISKECNRLSSTELTCYPYPETTVGKKYCSSGWELLLNEEQKIKEVNQGRKECCSPGQTECKEGGCEDV